MEELHTLQEEQASLIETVTDLKKQVTDLKEIVDFFVKQDRYLFQRDIDMFNGKNMKIGASLGTTIGQSTSKIGVFGATPITQPSSTGTTLNMTTVGGTAVTESNGFTGNTGSSAYTIGDIVKHLKLLGFLKQ